MMATNDTRPIQLDKEDTETLGNVLWDAQVQADADRSTYISDINDTRALVAAADEEDEDLRWPDACPFNVPLLKIYRNAFIARLSRALLKADPIFYFNGRDQISKQNEAYTERFHYVQAQEVYDLERVWRNSILSESLDVGTGVGYITWETVRKRKLQHVQSSEVIIDPETLEILTSKNDYRKEYGNQIIYDGPRILPIPIENVGVYPAASLDVQTAQGAYLKITLSGAELLDGMLTGKYDKQAVESLRASPFAAITHAKRDELERRGISLSDSSYNPNRDFQALPFDFVEWYWFYSNPKMPKELQCDWLITQEINTKVIVRAEPNPWGHGLRPLVISHVYPPKYGIIGESIGDYAGKFQQFFSWMLRGCVDGMDLRIDPELATGSGINEASLTRWREARGPGTIHDFNVDDLGKVLQPVLLGMNPNEALPIMQLVQSLSDLSVQYQNAFGGRPAARDVTLGELEKMSEEGQEGVMDMIDVASKSLTDAGRLIKELNYEFSGNDSVRQLWATVNPEAVDADVTAILGAKYSITTSGTTQSTNRSVRRQRGIDTITLLRDSGFWDVDPSGKRIYAAYRDGLVDGLGHRQAEPLIGTEEEAAQLPIAKQAAQIMAFVQQLQASAGGGGGGMPSDGNAPGGDTGVGMPPEMAGARE